MNIEKIRSQFPIFNVKKNGQKLVYLDSAATTQKPQQVIDAVTDFYTHSNASVHRGVYDLSEHATIRYEQVRKQVALFINASDSSEIIFTSGTTEGINFVADSWGMSNIKYGEEIVVTQVEHHANLLPWQRLAKRVGAKLKFINLNKKDFTLNSIDSNLINSKTKLVALNHVSNVLGPIWDQEQNQLESIIERAHKVGAKVLLDSAQGVLHQKVDVQKLKPDFLVFSGHKMFAPTGVGVLYISKLLHDAIEPYKVGGAMVYEASFQDASWQQAPHKFEAGTPPIAQVIGLGAAIDFFNEWVDFEKLRKHETKLCSILLDGLSKINGIVVLGNQDRLRKYGHLVTFVFQNIHAHDVSYMLNEKNFAVRAGHHCAQPLAKLLGIEASVRVSFSLYNTSDQIKLLLCELEKIVFKNL